MPPKQPCSPRVPVSPSPSLYDVDDDKETGFSKISRRKSVQAVKLLFAKSKVYLHPTPSAQDNVAGYIAILQQPNAPSAPTSPQQPTRTQTQHSSPSSARSATACASTLLAWLPEDSLGDALATYSKHDLSESDEAPKCAPEVPPPATITSHASTIGTSAFGVPLSDIYSLVVRPPNLGWWHGSIIVNSRNGEAFPPLFFHDSECQSTTDQRKKHLKANLDPFGDAGRPFWGGDQVMTWIKQFAIIERSPEPTVYLVNPTHEDKQGYGRPTTDKVAKALQGDSSTSHAAKSQTADPLAKAFKDARWNFLEKLSQVTTFTRRTAQAVAENDKVPVQVRRIMQNPQVQTVQDEFDSARIYLARWAMGIAEQSERDRARTIRSVKDALAVEDGELGDFEILDAQAQSLSLTDSRDPVTKSEWDGFFDSKGRLHVTPDEVKSRIFHGGLSTEAGVRAEAWLFLLGVHEWNSTTDERRATMNSLHDEYVRLKGSWWDRLMDGDNTLEEREWWKEQKMRIEKDVHRTDRHLPLFAGEDIPHPDPDSPFAEIGTNVHLEQMKDMLLTYNEYNRSLGYVQGMSDLLAPLYVVMQDDATAFWAFVNFMDRMERNFLRDQSGMRLQLQTLDHLVALMDPKLYLHLQQLDSTNFFFFFRPLLVWYKREFEVEDIMCLWERLWTDYYSANFHIFIAMAILEKHRSVIMDHLKGFDEVLKYINELSNTIDLESTLTRAEALFIRFRRIVEAIDKKHNFPTPSTRRLGSTSGQSPAASGSGSGSAPSSASPARPGDRQSKRASRGPSTTGTSASESSVAAAVAPEKAISPELRALLSRKVAVLERS